MHNPKKTKYSITRLVIAGIVPFFVGLTMIIKPVSYISPGRIGYQGSIPVVSVFTGNDSMFIGAMIMFMGSFILMVAYKIKNP
jgi:hypothetical protein